MIRRQINFIQYYIFQFPSVGTGLKLQVRILAALLLLAAGGALLAFIGRLQFSRSQVTVLRQSHPLEARQRPGFIHQDRASAALHRMAAQLPEAATREGHSLGRAIAIRKWCRAQQTGGWTENDNSSGDPLLLLARQRAGIEGTCRRFAYVFAGALLAAGLESRVVTVQPTLFESDDGHTLVEVWIPELNQWVLMDSMFNDMFTVDGEPAGALQVRAAMTSGNVQRVGFERQGATTEPVPSLRNHPPAWFTHVFFSDTNAYFDGYQVKLFGSRRMSFTHYAAPGIVAYPETLKWILGGTAVLSILSAVLLLIYPRARRLELKVARRAGGVLKSRRLVNGMMLSVSILCSLLAAEGLLRLFAPQQLILLRPDIWMPAAKIGWKHSANVDTRINSGEREVRWRTDAEGFRIGERVPASSEVTLVALGDSFLEARQVNYEDTMTGLLERRLSSSSGRRIRILNAGVGGFDPNQYRMILENILGRRSVDGVIVFVYLGNDVIQRREEDYQPKQPAERHLLRMPASLQWRELVDALAYPVNDMLEVRSHLFILAKNSLKYGLMRVNLTAYSFPVSLLASQAAAPRWNTTAAILEEIAAIAAQRGLGTLFVLIPSRLEVDPVEARKTADACGIAADAFDPEQPHRLLGAALRSRKLAVADLTPALRAAVAARIPGIYGNVDNHFGIGGHRVAAQTLEQIVGKMLDVKQFEQRRMTDFVEEGGDVRVYHMEETAVPELRHRRQALRR